MQLVFFTTPENLKIRGCFQNAQKETSEMKNIKLFFYLLYGGLLFYSFFILIILGGVLLYFDYDENLIHNT